jgi:hypothetical protein
MLNLTIKGFFQANAYFKKVTYRDIKMRFINIYFQKYKNKGFVGPKYQGMIGKAKLFFQDSFIHNEIIQFAEPHDFRFNSKKYNSDAKLKIINVYDEFLKYKDIFESEYYRGYTKKWEQIFSWGDKLGLIFVEDQLCGFGWFHSWKTVKLSHYIPLQKNDYRVLRGGVLPNARRHRINTTRHILFLKYLFEIGAKRVYTDAFEDNIPSVKSQRYAGYKYLGHIQVLHIPYFDKQFIRWIEKPFTL